MTFMSSCYVTSSEMIFPILLKVYSVIVIIIAFDGLIQMNEVVGVLWSVGS